MIRFKKSVEIVNLLPYKNMSKNSNMVDVYVKALKNFYDRKGNAYDISLYQGHSKLTKSFVKLNNMTRSGY